jgi:Golgi nucleoside diphosphatase
LISNIFAKKKTKKKTQVVDMLGCRVPVLAKRFPAIDELVVDGVSGYLFDKAQVFSKF